MIIRCPECQTRFRLADEKMKPGGTKVRCSRCRHIFTATAPDLPQVRVAPPAEEGVDFDAFNMQNLADGGDDPVSPPARAEAPAVERESAFRIAAPPADSGQSEEGASASSAFEWTEEFSLGLDSPAKVAGAPAEDGEGNEDEIPLPRAQSPAGEFSFGQEEAAAADGEFSFGQEEAAAADGEFSFGQEEVPAADGEFSFGEESSGDEEFSFGAEEAPAGGSEFSFGEEEPDAGAGFGFSFDDADEPLAERGADPVDERGGGGEFDFSNMNFGSDQPEAAPVYRTESPPVPRPELSAPAVESAREGDRGFSESLPVMVAPVRPRKSPFSGVLALVVLLLLTLAGAAGYFFWQGGAPDLAQFVARLSGGNAPQAPGQIRLTGLNGSFIQNREVGPLFVIRGTAVNDYRESRSSIAVKGVLYNHQGQPLVQQTVFSGNTLDEEVLRTVSFVKIEESMNNQFGDSLSNLNVSPGKSIPFTIVFKNLPPDLAEFTVEIADSKPGSG